MASEARKASWRRYDQSAKGRARHARANKNWRERGGWYLDLRSALRRKIAADLQRLEDSTA